MTDQRVVRVARWGLAVVAVFLLGRPLFSADPPKDVAASWMDQVQKKYSSLSSYQAHFVQKFVQGKDQRVESGVLWLSRGGKMRWDYAQPEAKVFLVNGKTQYTWIPSEKRVYRESLKASDDERKPILLLLGHLPWRKVFSKVEMRDPAPAENNRLWLRAYPKNETLGYESVEFQVERNTLHLLQIRIDNMDRSKMEFSFSEVVENPRIEAQRFSFRIPRDAEVVQQ